MNDAQQAAIANLPGKPLQLWKVDKPERPIRVAYSLDNKFITADVCQHGKVTIRRQAQIKR